jgi:hypothetical protein
MVKTDHKRQPDFGLNGHRGRASFLHAWQWLEFAPPPFVEFKERDALRMSGFNVS